MHNLAIKEFWKIAENATNSWNWPIIILIINCIHRSGPWSTFNVFWRQTLHPWFWLCNMTRLTGPINAANLTLLNLDVQVLAKVDGTSKVCWRSETPSSSYKSPLCVWIYYFAISVKQVLQSVEIMSSFCNLHFLRNWDLHSRHEKSWPEKSPFWHQRVDTS